MDYHLRITPRGLDLPSWEVLSDALDATRFSAHQEGANEGLHYHIYLTTQTAIKTLRNRILSKCNFPAGKRGEENAYYMLKQITTKSKNRKDLDLQKFTLGYTAKGGTLVYLKEFATSQLDEARIYYMDKTARRAISVRADVHQVDSAPPESIERLRIPLEAQVSPLAPREPKQTPTENQYERYIEYMDDHIAKTEYAVVVPVKAIKYWSIRFFESENGLGLLPQKAHIHRFISSYTWRYVRKKQTLSSAEMIEELISLGYV